MKTTIDCLKPLDILVLDLGSLRCYVCSIGSKAVRHTPGKSIVCKSLGGRQFSLAIFVSCYVVFHSVQFNYNLI